MRTLAYDGPQLVHVHSIAQPAGAEPIDAIAQITATRIWAADHPVHEGRMDFAEGSLVRHESLADVLEVSDGASTAQVGDVLHLRLNVACGRCANCERGAGEHCLTAQLGAAGTGPLDVSAAQWSIRAAELDAAWERIKLLLHAHPAGWHSAPLAPSVLAVIGSVGSGRPTGDEPPPDYPHFGRWDDGWASVMPRPTRAIRTTQDQSQK